MGLVRGQAPEDEDWIALAGAGHYVMALAMLGVALRGRASASGCGSPPAAPRRSRRCVACGRSDADRPARECHGPLPALEREMSSPALSVLDLVPVRSDQTSADAVAASLELARTADRLGYRRYWVAEHHNMPAVAATNPPVLIGLLGRADVPDPGRLRRRDAAQPRPARRRGAVRAPRGGVPGPDRPRHRPRAGHRPGDELGAPARRGRRRRRGGQPVPGVRRQRARDDGAERRGSRAARPEPRAEGDPVGRVGPADLVARLFRLLRAPRRREGHALRLRPPLLRLRARPRRSTSTAAPSGRRPSSTRRGPS